VEQMKSRARLEGRRQSAEGPKFDAQESGRPPSSSERRAVPYHFIGLPASRAASLAASWAASLAASLILRIRRHLWRPSWRDCGAQV